MSSRMSKYYDETENINSRVRRNEELYKEINRNSLSSFEVKSNARVIGDNDKEIDVEKIKKILDTKYNEMPKRKSIRIEEPNVEKDKQEITKEYDINVVLEKAKEQKEDNYEEERLKKLRDTEFNILKNLDLEKYENSKSETEEDENLDEDDNLKKLINTIYDNENLNNSASLDILSDLKGHDDTEVFEGLKEQVKEKNGEEEQENDNKIEDDTKLTNSFYTTSNEIKDNDFEDMESFAKEINSSNIFIRILLVIIALAFIVGVVLIIRSIYF